MATSFDGLYALASLDGALLSPRDLALLDLTMVAGQGFAVAARDRGTALHVGPTHAFLGHLDEPASLAATLGLDAATTPADLLLAAVARWGDEAPVRVLGEWAYLHWNGPARTLTLAVADTIRDPLLFATDGRRVAVAPHIRALRRLDWIDAAPDGAGLLLYMGRAGLRATIGDRTILRDVRKVTAGTRVRVARDGVTVGRRAAFPIPERWRGSFADAMETLEATWRTILREQMARHPAAAVMLSGGLDSSLIAAFAAAERGPSGSLVAVTSAAPVGSGLPDEVEFARAVADQAGIDMLPVAPPADADVYLPSREMLGWLQQPIASPRHYIYDALYRAAADGGADAVFDGCEGEATLTGYPDDAGWRHRLRGIRTWARARLSGRADDGGDAIGDAFHVRLGADARAFAERCLQAELATPNPVGPVHRRGDLWGYSPDLAKHLAATTTSQHAGVRNLLPFRDRRLLTLFAGMPYAFISHGGVTRAPARALLAGKVPEHVRLRRQGRPFAPDFLDRIRRQAGPARDRLPEFARAGVDEWLDIQWLDAVLARIAAGAEVSLDTVFEVQTTATAAAFLADWSSGQG